ncbi:unnamed protein product [Aureobasidium uvarum]|uniref:Isochorismatase-like domain-containing protein n=1 Tax=Aureobasidium uvarum TaxID=2773716 RepID=A0A9N8KQB5_9PEZI|nr:unnamed protein product [Aureobasidium uvarum]
MDNRTALVIVDVQDGIANVNDGVPDADRVKQAINSVLHLARQHNKHGPLNEDPKHKIEILFVQHDDNDPSDPLHRGKPTWELVFPPRQGIETERLISKNVGDMFISNPNLANSLRMQGITNLVFVGLQTDFCVRASILGAIASGFEASNIKLLQGTHSTYDNIVTGKSYVQIKEDVEKQMANIGVCLRDWKEFDFERDLSL